MLTLTHHGTRRLISLSIKVSAREWDARRRRVKNHPHTEMLNGMLSGALRDAEEVIARCAYEGTLTTLSIEELKERIAIAIGRKEAPRHNENCVLYRFQAYANSRTAASTRNLYALTLRHLLGYCPTLDSLTFEQIDSGWLDGFNSYLAQTSPAPNARAIHMRNLRAVFNAAIDDGITTHYPFRRYKIRPTPTRKRSLDISTLRQLLSYPCEKRQQCWIDYFALIFCLIGINVTDLYHLAAINDGRIQYRRAKTARLYDIKVEAEALTIINRHRGLTHLLDIPERFASPHGFMASLNKGLRSIGQIHRTGRGGKKHLTPLLPDITSYWARHTWATIAASLDIPKETIARALGHGGNTTTDIYIDYDMRKVDEANRKVLDYVFSDLFTNANSLIGTDF